MSVSVSVSVGCTAPGRACAPRVLSFVAGGEGGDGGDSVGDKEDAARGQRLSPYSWCVPF